MARKRRKGKGREKKTMDADLISKLPDHVIHHILSFIPTIDAVRMSLLSMHWRRMWYSVPALDFPDSDIETVEQWFKHRKMGMHHDTNSVITRFKVDIYYDGESSQVDSWLSFAAQSHLQELDLKLGNEFYGRELYSLPLVALNLTSLTILNLVCVKLEACYPMSLPSLKSLSLRTVDLEEEVLQNLLSGCPSIEKLNIEECHRLYYLQVSSLSLKFLEICGHWYEIHVDAINLQSFAYKGDEYLCNFDFASCKNIKNLSLYNAVFEFVQYPESGQISELPILESLILSRCDNITGIRNPNLKVFVFEKGPDLDEEFGDIYEFSIDAPNLVTFNYCGEETLVKFSMNSPNLLEANLDLRHYKEDFSMDWYINLIDFLSYLDCSKSISLLIHSDKALMFPEKLRKFCCSPLPDLEHLEVKISHKVKRKSYIESYIESYFRDALHWLSPCVETLSVEFN